MPQKQSQHFADRIVIGDEDHVNRNIRDDADGVVLVGQMQQLTAEAQQAWLMTNVELLSAEWAFQFSIENESEGTRTKEETTEIGMTVTSGREVSDSVSASAGFSGFGFSAEVSGSTETKTFTTVETSSVRTVTDTAWFYSKEHDAWIENANGDKFESEFVNEIIANQELISPVELKNHGRITNDPPSGLALPTKGWRPDGSVLWDVWLVIIYNTYPWTR